MLPTLPRKLVVAGVSMLHGLADYQARECLWFVGQGVRQPLRFGFGVDPDARRDNTTRMSHGGVTS